MNLNWIQKLLPTADFKILSASAPKVFSTNGNHKFCAAEINHWTKKHSPKTTHPMTNSAPSEKLRKQFCQTHILTIDRPERRQRCRHGTSGHSTRDITNRTAIDSSQNFYNAPDQLVPVNE